MTYEKGCRKIRHTPYERMFMFEGFDRVDVKNSGEDNDRVPRCGCHSITPDFVLFFKALS